MSADRYYNQSDFEEYSDEPENNNPNLIMASSNEITDDPAANIKQQQTADDGK